MKKYLYFSSICFILLLLTIFPNLCSDGVALGINLLINSLIPAIFCFIVFSNIMISSGYAFYLGKIFYPVIHRLFHTSATGSYALVMGFLCGFPVGAKILNDLEYNGEISPEESTYLYHFINHVSPAFVQGYFVYSILQSPSKRLLVLFLIYAPELILGFIFRPDTPFSYASVKKHHTPSVHQIIEHSFMNGWKSILSISFYVIIFSVLICFIQACVFLPLFLRILLISLSEMTSGLYVLSHLSLSAPLRLLLLCYVCVFGGFSTLFQIKGIVSSKQFRIKTYLSCKCLAIVITTVLWLGVYFL